MSLQLFKNWLVECQTKDPIFFEAATAVFEVMFENTEDVLKIAQQNLNQDELTEDPNANPLDPNANQAGSDGDKLGLDGIDSIFGVAPDEDEDDTDDLSDEELDRILNGNPTTTDTDTDGVFTEEKD